MEKIWTMMEVEREIGGFEERSYRLEIHGTVEKIFEDGKWVDDVVFTEAFCDGKPFVVEDNEVDWAISKLREEWERIR